MARSLDFIQIYYEDSQLEKLYPFSKPFKNTTLTPYFENAIIKEIAPTLTADLIGICSWRLSDKRNDYFRLVDKSLSLVGLSADTAFDIAVLTPRSGSHKMLYMASAWHGEPWNDAILELREFIKIPKEVSCAIYENHFIATKEIYHEYVNNCLAPCIDFMSSRPVFFADSGYINRKKGADRESVRKILSESLQRTDYPIAPFILERLFSIWIENKNFNIISL
jgi:hypothetical protein